MVIKTPDIAIGTTVAAIKPPRVKPPRQWTPARQLVTEAYIKVLKKNLQLVNWEVAVDWAELEPDEDCYATNQTEPRSRHVTIRFSRRFLDLSPRLQRQALVHEMLHCYTHSMEDLVSSCLEKATSKTAGNVISVALEHEVEVAVDALADILAPLMPEFRLR